MFLIMKELRDIISELRDGSLRESSSIELKCNLPHDKVLVANNIIDLANNLGGYFIVGVQENNQGIDLVGVREASAVVKTLDNILKSLTRGVTGNLSVHSINKRDIVILKVDKSKSFAYYYRTSLEESFFLVVLGDINNSHFEKMKERLVRIGETRRILENAFLLSIDESHIEPWTIQKVRNIVAGDDLGYCLVIRINKSFSSAWNLTKDDSLYFIDILEKLQDGKAK